jgi:hypothetical protein
MRIVRVFPRRTRATPVDSLSYVGDPDLFVQADEVHISVSFSWDIPEAERLADVWKYVAPVKLGGPATGMVGSEFIPGRFLRPGYVITSRGCPNRCWHCEVWKRDGDIRELPIRDGWNVLDDNLLACSEEHIRAVFSMLSRQNRRPEFTGGLEAARLKPWHVEALRRIHARQIFLAYDGPEDRDPLHSSAEILFSGGFTQASHRVRCYVLIGYDGDTPEKAEARLVETVEMGFTPMAMYYRGKNDMEKRIPREWWKFRRLWSRPGAIHGRRILHAS